MNLKQLLNNFLGIVWICITAAHNQWGVPKICNILIQEISPETKH